MGSSLFADEPIALITKSRGNAKYKISLDNKFLSNARINTPIFHGNGIKTKSKSFAQIVYLDDRSTVSAYPKTEFTINGTIENRIIRKHVDITMGIVKVNILNQITSEFKLSTPHSELNCHECDFWVISDEKTGDRFYKISGDALVTNLSMSETMALQDNTTIRSLKETEMIISKTHVTESKYLELLMFDADEISKQSVEELMIKKIANQSVETTSNIVEIRLKNALNIERKIILTFTK